MSAEVDEVVDLRGRATRRRNVGLVTGSAVTFLGVVVTLTDTRAWLLAALWTSVIVLWWTLVLMVWHGAMAAVYAESAVVIRALRDKDDGALRELRERVHQ